MSTGRLQLTGRILVVLGCPKPERIAPFLRTRIGTDEQNDVLATAPRWILG